MDNMGSPTPDGTEGIVHVKIPKTDGIGTDDLIGCIINYQKLGIRDSSCYGQYRYMLLLPVNSNNNIKYENIEDINATFYNFEEEKQQTLKLEKVLVEPEKLTHQFLPCIMEDREKRGNCTFKGPKSESEKAQSYVSKYSKIVGLDILKARESWKQRNELFGISKSDNMSRAKFVSLKFSKDEPGILEKCSDLHPCGVLLHGKKYFVNGNPKYDVEVIGSYSLVDGKITYKLILDEVNQTNANDADCSSAINGQNAEAMSDLTEPSGSVSSDTQLDENDPLELTINQIHYENPGGEVDHIEEENTSKSTIDINKAIANNTNANKKREGGPSGSSEQFVPSTLENDESDENFSVKDEIDDKLQDKKVINFIEQAGAFPKANKNFPVRCTDSRDYFFENVHTTLSNRENLQFGTTNGQNTSVFSKCNEDKEKIEGKDLAKSPEAFTSSTPAETQVNLQLQELKKILKKLESPLDRLREGKSILNTPEEMLTYVNDAQIIITRLKNTKVLDLSLTYDAEMKQLNVLEECLQDHIRTFHSNAEVEDQFGKLHLYEIHDTLKIRDKCLAFTEEKPFSSPDQQLSVVENINSVCSRIISKIEDSSKRKHNLQINQCPDSDSVP